MFSFFSVCFFLFVFFLNLYRGFIAVLKYVRSYLHSLGLVTETNKNNILLTCFSVMPGFYLKSSSTIFFLILLYIRIKFSMEAI